MITVPRRDISPGGFLIILKSPVGDLFFLPK